MHGLENQTRESIKLLKKNKTPFVIALNKIDRLYQWQKNPTQVCSLISEAYAFTKWRFLKDVNETLKKQKRVAKDEFQTRFDQVFNQMAAEEFNVKLFSNFTEDDDPLEWTPVVPTSAHSGSHVTFRRRILTSIFRRWNGKPDGTGDRSCSKCLRQKNNLQ